MGVNAYMKTKYPFHKLVMNVIHADVCETIKAVLIKILNFLYIEDDAHVYMKYS